jgi:hypothetical protein
MIKVKLPEPDEYAFIHIPKNAGVSMQDALANIPNIKYFGHGVIFHTIQNMKKIFILREPISRFTSAFFYLKKYKKNRENNFFQNPRELVDAMLDFDVRAFNFLKVQNHSHFVDGTKINTDWVFHPQSSWVFDPFRVMIYENLQEEIAKLNEDLGVDILLEVKNKSEKLDFEYSDDNIDYLKLVYKKDFQLYNKYNVQSNRQTAL